MHSVAEPSQILRFPQQVLPVAAGAKPAVLNRPMLVQSAATVLAPGDALLHDARNALASLYLLSGLLREPGVLDGGNRGYAEDLERVTRSLDGLLSGLAKLHGASGAAQEPLPPLRAGTAGEAVKGCAPLLQTIAGPGIAVHISAENNLPPLQLDDDSLARVLSNLVKNASEAMPAGGTVNILARRALSRNSKAVLVHVSDDGPGIPAYALGRIFEPGFSSKRSAGAPSSAEPYGLGLAIVRELVESTGGAVKVASTRRRGTTFELRLPCLPAGEGNA